MTTTMDKTQTIDADALRARLAETPADLRGRIEAALRARDPDAGVIVSGIPGDDVAVALGESVVTARVGSARALAPTGTEAAALAALAVAVGLDADGSDPRVEVERLRAESERRSELLDDVAHAHERDVLAVWAALGETHEPPENIAAVVGAVERLRALLAVTQSSLEAASSGRRVTACEDIERLQRETLRLRSLIPDVAFIRCPACGVRRAADLDDDAVYVMRRHLSPATGVDYGDFVWCDGGVVSEVKS